MASAPPGPRPDALPPGPGPLAVLHWIFRPLPFLEECARRYGSAFTVRARVLGLPTVVAFSEPAAIRQIFTIAPERMLSGQDTPYFRQIVGANSLLVLGGARHLRERKLLMPPFHGERMQQYSAAMREIADRSLDEWPTGIPFPVHARFQEITLEVILRVVFGVTGAQMARLRTLLRAYIELATGGSPLRVLFGWRRFRRLRDAIHSVLQEEIGRCRSAAADSRIDILSLLVAARDEDGRPMADDEIRDELITMLIAGHETTATSLAWAVHQLLTHPEALAAARAEVAEVCGDRTPTAEHVAELRYLDAVIKETARLRPIAPTVVRWLTEPAHIGGWDLPAGAAVAPCVYLTHRRPDLWPDPETFDPTRFLGRRVDPYAFYPFGGGVRHCLGAAFAAWEMKVVLARVLMRADLRPEPAHRVRMVRRGVLLGPSGGVPVVRAAG